MVYNPTVRYSTAGTTGGIASTIQGIGKDVVGAKRKKFEKAAGSLPTGHSTFSGGKQPFQGKGKGLEAK